MKIQWYRSATVGIFTNAGTKVLCDPWLTDGAFIGSWYHWPPLDGSEFESVAETEWDAIYISHLHADHFDRKLTSRIARKNLKTVAVIPKFNHNWLKRAVENCGFSGERLIEVESNSTFQLKDLKIKMFAADYCNPVICGVSIPCTSISTRESSIDSLALFEADEQKILNANDALAVQSAHKIWPLIGKIDVLMGHYGGAGPYPQAFPEIPHQIKLQQAEQTSLTFVKRLVDTANTLSARYVMPYAGQYVLGGKLASLNMYRSVMNLDRVFNFIKDHSSAKPISLQPFGYFDLDTGLSSKKWVEPSAETFKEYISKISNAKYPYEVEEDSWDNERRQVFDALENVRIEFDRRIQNGMVGSQSTISIKSDKFTYNLNFDKDQCTITQNDVKIFNNRTIIELDSRLLKRLIKRRELYKGFTQYHFNQAEIGSHLRWYRSGPYPPETVLLNFMQTSSN